MDHTSCSLSFPVSFVLHEIAPAPTHTAWIERRDFRPDPTLSSEAVMIDGVRVRVRSSLEAERVCARGKIGPVHLEGPSERRARLAFLVVAGRPGRPAGPLFSPATGVRSHGRDFRARSRSLSSLVVWHSTRVQT
ncbi:hypothetical protein BT93_C1612 [Corymbia citriodora subsp. variegata]|nr:hypothetical protein BT93_C1612 [Corymbia citriodora subsp. variegata]